ncbi:hypothetical protein BH23THE1_BH23THE1_25250 [soil metagenome]
MRYYSEDNNLVTLRFADADIIMSDSMEDVEVGEDENKNVVEIVDKYYSEFIVKHGKDDQNDVSHTNDSFEKSPSSEEYLQTVKNNNNF